MKYIATSFLILFVLLTLITAGAQQKTDVEATAAQVVAVLHNRDMNSLARFAHPTKGIRFSPYEYVQPSRQVMKADQIRSKSNRSYLWGYYDGSGFPIDLTFENYFQRFVYDRDYIHAPHVGRNSQYGSGNTINNIAEFYPHSERIEYHFPPNDDGFDWNSLWLVFEEFKGKWCLVAIIHGEWTI